MATFHRAKKKELDRDASYILLVFVLLVQNGLINLPMYFLASILTIR